MFLAFFPNSIDVYEQRRMEYSDVFGIFSKSIDACKLVVQFHACVLRLELVKYKYRYNLVF